MKGIMKEMETRGREPTQKRRNINLFPFRQQIDFFPGESTMVWMNEVINQPRHCAVFFPQVEISVTMSLVLPVA